MSYSSYLILKAIILCIAAAVWGAYCGITGRPLQPGPRDTKETDPKE